MGKPPWQMVVRHKWNIIIAIIFKSKQHTESDLKLNHSRLIPKALSIAPYFVGFFGFSLSAIMYNMFPSGHRYQVVNSKEKYVCRSEDEHSSSCTMPEGGVMERALAKESRAWDLVLTSPWGTERQFSNLHNERQCLIHEVAMRRK